MGNKLRTVIIVAVTLVWAVNFTAPVFVKGYEPSPELNVAFMAIIGVLTATYGPRGKRDDDTPGDGSD